MNSTHPRDWPAVPMNQKQNPCRIEIKKIMDTLRFIVFLWNSTKACPLINNSRI
jgi:hypothetical protein